MAAGAIRIEGPLSTGRFLASAMTDLDHDPRPQPPEPPGENECCGSGCPLCVLDLYADELTAYRQRLAQWLARHPGQV